MITRIAAGTTPDLETLRAYADDEGLSFVSRTAVEWSERTNRFDRNGEVFFVAHLRAEPVGMCGLNIDPFLADARIGRLRHLYVVPHQRRQGIAGRLVTACLDLATGSFDLIRLRTFDPIAAAFYVAMGFSPVAEPDATHSIATPSR